ncbi:hypothetical protein [Rhodospirillaceae bacterium SYSU D60014]|jgi:hypothetical protein|uniref:hypothetical protein n=1 Tax=Virgifigura deserti TaxID=2268457 RepID=UPI0013C49780
MPEKPKTDQPPHREILLAIEAVLGESCASVSDGFPSRRGRDAARMISQALRRARAH